MRHRAYIAIGSNIEPERNMKEGLVALHARCPIVRLSRFYRTAPLGAAGQPDFVNAVCEIETGIEPLALKEGVLRAIEAAQGRVRSADKFAPRPLDLDILLYGDRVIVTPDLTLPDPGLFTRAFLCRALFEIAGDLRLPGSGERLEALCARVPPWRMEALPDLEREVREALGLGT